MGSFGIALCVSIFLGRSCVKPYRWSTISTSSRHGGSQCLHESEIPSSRCTGATFSDILPASSYTPNALQNVTIHNCTAKEVSFTRNAPSVAGESFELQGCVYVLLVYRVDKLRWERYLPAPQNVSITVSNYTGVLHTRNRRNETSFRPTPRAFARQNHRHGTVLFNQARRTSMILTCENVGNRNLSVRIVSQAPHLFV